MLAQLSKQGEKISALKSAVEDYIEQRFSFWLRRRIPKDSSITLNQRRLFIFPTRQGFYFLTIILLVLISAINYENNLAFALSFFLASLFNTAILFTFNNVSGVNIKAFKAYPNFAGDHVAFDLAISRKNNKQHQQLRLFFKGEAAVQVSLLNQAEQVVKVFHYAPKRGMLSASRLRVESIYPLGLIRCWTWVDLDLEVAVYPKPLSFDLPALKGESEEGEKPSLQQGDEFQGLKTYQFGDSLTQAYWPSLAKGQRLQNKVFSSFVADDHWLSYDEIHQGNQELSLSRLAYWALMLSKKNEVFGLRLPGQQIEMGQGDKHLEQVLLALALFNLPSAEHHVKNVRGDKLLKRRGR